MNQWKKRLAAAMVLSLAGCAGKPAETPSASNAPALPEETASVSLPDPENAYAGGNPWTDYGLKENISADITLSEQEDFYYAVNKDWLVNTELPEGEPYLFLCGQTMDETQKKALAILDGKRDSESHSEALIRDLYHSFLDWEARNALGTTPLEETVNKIKAIETLEDLKAFMLEENASFLVPHLIWFGNEVSLNDSSRYVTELGQDSLILSDPAEYKERTAAGERRYAGILCMLEHLLPRIGYAKEDAKTMLDQAVAFEQSVADVSYTRADRYAEDYLSRINNTFAKEKLKELVSAWPLEEMLEAYGYGSAESFLVQNPAALKAADALYSSENLEEIKNLMIVKTAVSYCPLLDQDAYGAYIDGKNRMNGSSGREEDTKAALNLVRSALSGPMSKAYVEAYDYSGLKQEIYDLCRNIIGKYRKMLEKEDWLSETTRKKAIEKLDHLTVHSLYPDQWVDYGSLDLTGLSYFDCRRAIHAFDRALNSSRTNGTVDPNLWEIDVLIPDAYNDSQSNSINMILGMVGEPLYSSDSSKEELMGAYGSVIGHEISHCFDTVGARFDKDGNLNDWWTEEDYAAFRKRTGKMIDFFNRIEPWKGETVNGELIQKEVIADSAGLKVMLEIAREEPEFDYRKFFRSYARMWGRIATPEYEYYLLKNDSHPLCYLRVNAIVQQFQEFHDAFGIRENDRMYLAPENRFEIW